MEERFAVTAATGILGPILVKLTALLGDEYKLQEGTRQDIVSIKSDLEPVHDLLWKLWGREDLDVACKDWMTEARELSYDMEDGIDGFTLGLERGEDGSFIQRGGTVSPSKEFMGRVKDVSKRCGRMQEIGHTICNSSRLSTDPRALFLHRDASELVGMEEKEEELIRLLQEHEMVWIVGLGGMGKTTLADLVYDTLRDEFQCRAFVFVHPSPNMMEILGTILSQVTDGATSAGSGSEPSAERNIVDDISVFLSDKRYLVVIDDIWHWEEWEVIRKALPTNNRGCKIIVTTRIETIAKKCQTEKDAYVYRLRFGYWEATRLSDMRLNKSVKGHKYKANEKGLSTKIADTCDLIPLAVICLSSAWAESHIQGDYSEWDAWVSQLLMDKFLSTPSLKPLVQSLCLGFDDLPIPLRTCLLYCSTYPQAYPIERHGLVSKWIAEGFVWQEAEAYIDKLVSRNLLKPEGENLYRIHPLMHALLVCKAKEDHFIVSFFSRKNSFVACRHYNGPSSFSHAKQMIRRVSLYTDCYPDDADVSHSRTLVLGPEPQPDVVPFKKFSKLRVLEIGSRGLDNGHLMDICGLICLRCLVLKWASITEIPPEIGRLQNLQTLNISGTEVKDLPREVGKLQNLQILNISGTKFKDLPGEVGRLQNLQTLNVSGTGVNDLPREVGKLQNLQNLNISGTKFKDLPGEVAGLQNLQTLNISGTGVNDLPREVGKLQHLRTLDISDTKVTVLPREISELERLENLYARNTPVRKLPKEIRKLQHLRALDVRGTHVKLFWEVPNSLTTPSVLIDGIMHSANKLVKLPQQAVRPDWVITSSGAKLLSMSVVTICFGEILQFAILTVAGRHMKVPQWVKQDLSNVESLDIRLCKLRTEDLESLKQMPNLQVLVLRLEVLPREPVAITGGGFSKLEAFYFDCRLPQMITFRSGAMQQLKYLVFKFYSGGPASQDYSMGIKHLPSLEKLIFGCSEYYTSDSPGISATIDVMRKEAADHPNEISLWVDEHEPEVFGRGAKWISQADKAIMQKRSEENKRIMEQRELLCRAAERRATRERDHARSEEMEVFESDSSN